MSRSREYRLQVAPDRVIRGTVELPPSDASPRSVLFCHGFKGFKDWGGWPWFARSLADRGFLVHRFNFSLSGVGESLDRHDEPEKFARNTYGAELEDLHLLLDRRREWEGPESTSEGSIGLVGHSRGGLVALLVGGEREEIGATVTLGSPGNSDRFPPEARASWRERGFEEIVNARTGERLRLELSVLDDYEANATRYDVSRAVRERDVPTLVLHGDRDESVSPEESGWIEQAIPHSRKERVILTDTGHTFGMVHPFDGTNPALAEALDRTARWLDEHLGS